MRAIQISLHLFTLPKFLHGTNTPCDVKANQLNDFEVELIEIKNNEGTARTINPLNSKMKEHIQKIINIVEEAQQIHGASLKIKRNNKKSCQDSADGAEDDIFEKAKKSNADMTPIVTTGYTLQTRSKSISVEERDLIKNILDGFDIVGKIRKTGLDPSGKSKIIIEISNHVTDKTLSQAHANWTEEYFKKIKKPSGFPGKWFSTKMSASVVHVGIDITQKNTGGMGRHYPFIGCYLSLLIDLKAKKIIDSRYEYTD